MSVTIIKQKLGYDDSLDVFGVHGVGGMIGALATGLFAQKIVNPAGNDGLLFGNPHQLVVQAIAVGSTIAYAVTATAIILKVLDAVMGLQVNEDDETIGLDHTQHQESAYTLLD